MGKLCIYLLVISASTRALWQKLPSVDDISYDLWKHDLTEQGCPLIMGIVLGRWELLSLPLSTEDPDFAAMRAKIPRGKLKGLRGWCVWRALEFAFSTN